MEKGWKQVLLTTHEYKSSMAKDILEKNNIKTVIINRKDSSYLSFGEIAVYVEESNENRAIELIKDLIN